MPSSQHQSLIELTAKWLRARDYKLVVADVRKRLGQSLRGEMPDVICWANCAHSAVAEIKVSKADALADRAKVWREDGQGMGNERFMVSPSGVLDRSDIPPYWWWVEEVDGELHVRIQGERFNKASKGEELGLVLTLLQAAEYQTSSAGKRQKGGSSLHKPAGDFAALVKQYDTEYPGAMPKHVVKALPGLVSMAGNKTRAIAMVGQVRDSLKSAG